MIVRGASLWAGQLLACFIVLSSGATWAASPQAIVKVTGHPNWPPFSFQSGGHIDGIGAQLAQIVFHDLGFEVVNATSGNWKRAQAQVAAGAMDVLVAAYKTSERETYLAYPEVWFMDDVNVIWVRKGEGFPLKRWEDLIGKQGTAMLGESYGERFDRFIVDKLQIERVSTPLQSLQKLAMGRADYYPFSLHAGRIQLKEFGFTERIENLAFPISTEHVYFGVSKKSKFASLMPQIAAAIERRRADGTIERLIRQYEP